VPLRLGLRRQAGGLLDGVGLGAHVEARRSRALELELAARRGGAARGGGRVHPRAGRDPGPGVLGGQRRRGPPGDGDGAGAGEEAEEGGEGALTVTGMGGMGVGRMVQHVSECVGVRARQGSGRKVNPPACSALCETDRGGNSRAGPVEGL
jgi:hypothetical protein